MHVKHAYVINFVFVMERIKDHVTYIVKILWIFRFIVLFVCLFGSNPVRDSDFFLCSTLMTCWLFHLHSNKVISIIIIWAWLKLFHCKWPRWRSTTLKNICFMTNKHVKTTYLEFHCETDDEVQISVWKDKICSKREYTYSFKWIEEECWIFDTLVHTHFNT